MEIIKRCDKMKKKQTDILKIEYFPREGIRKITYRGGAVEIEKIKYPIEIFDKEGNLVYKLNEE